MCWRFQLKRIGFIDGINWDMLKSDAILSRLLSTLGINYQNMRSWKWYWQIDELGNDRSVGHAENKWITDNRETDNLFPEMDPIKLATETANRCGASWKHPSNPLHQINQIIQFMARAMVIYHLQMNNQIIRWIAGKIFKSAINLEWFKPICYCLRSSALIDMNHGS